MKNFKLYGYALLASVGLLFTSCGSDDSSSDSLPPIGGYNSADEIGASDLVGYWPLNGNGVETKSNTNPSGTFGVTYGTGIKGQAGIFNEGYLNYPSITNLSTTSGSITISCWAKVSNNGGTNGHPSVFFSMGRSGEWAGNINLMAETGWQPSTIDTLTVKGLAVIKNTDGSANWQDIINKTKGTAEEIAAGATPFANKVAGTWAHFVIVWDGTAGTFKLFANGTKISNTPWESRNGGNPLALSYFTPTNPVIGAFATVPVGTTETWQKGLTGSLDEIRVWKKALSAADINALYQLELAGR